jgi:virginiamycin B lyase
MRPASRARRWLVLLAACIGSTLSLPVAQAATPPIGKLVQFRLPTGIGPRHITKATDGNLWFTAQGPFDAAFNRPGQVSRITPGGTITEFNACDVCQPSGLVQGPDGIIYFDSSDSFLRRITTSGNVMDPIAIPGGVNAFETLAADSTSVYFTDRNQIGRYNVATGAFSFFAVPTPGPNISDLEVANGIVWFTESNDGDLAKIGRLDPAARRNPITEFVVGVRPRSLAIAPNGEVWFTEIFANAIGRLTPGTGQVSHFPTAAGANPEDIAAGDGSNLWFTQSAAGNIARISPTGVIAEAKVVKGSGPLGITIGQDGNPWYTEWGPDGSNNKIATVKLS